MRDDDGLCSHCGAPLYPSERCDCWDRTAMTDPQTIVEGMTRAQREAILTLTKYPQNRSIMFSVRVGYALERIGLAARTLMSDSTYLTPLGLAVRTHLEKESKK